MLIETVQIPWSVTFWVSKYCQLTLNGFSDLVIFCTVGVRNDVTNYLN